MGTVLGSLKSREEYRNGAFLNLEFFILWIIEQRVYLG